MKKHKMKNLFKIGILIFGISFSILNCEKETIVNDNSLENHTTNNFEVEKVKLDQIINDNELKASLKKIEKQFDYNKNKTTLSKSSDNSISILTDDIIHVKTDSTEAYTFRIDKLTHPNSSFENFIIEKRNNNEYQFFIYRYSESNQKHKGEQVYNLSRELVENAEINTIDPNNYAGKYIYDEVSDCLMWIYESSGDCGCAVIEIDQCNVMGGGGGTSSGGSTSGTGSSPSGGGTSSGSSGGSTGSGSSTVGLLTPKLAWELIEDCLGESLANESLTWLQTQNEFDILPINTYLQDNSCSVEAKVFAEEAIEIMIELPNAKFERITELNELLNENPWALIQDCAEQNGMDTSNYLDLYNTPFPQECSDRLFNLGVEWHHQPITDGNVPLANIDYYSVEITDYPDLNNNGEPDTEAEMYQAFRNNFINLASGEVDDFQFSCDVPGNPTDTGDINWQFEPLTVQDGIDFVSNNPIASILLIEAEADGLVPTIAADDGAVIVSNFTTNDWTISTIMTANNGTQPFSGNRQWGWLINQNGNFEFFTRAVDVANISKLLNVLSLGGANTECQQDTYYNIAEATWENMQQEIAQWINDNGGQATIIPKTAVRVDREKIEELLTSNETINQINCD